MNSSWQAEPVTSIPFRSRLLRTCAGLLAVALLSGCASLPPVVADAPAPATSMPTPSSTPTPSEASPSPTAPSPTATPSAPSEARPLAGRVIVIDPGHNRNTNGRFIRHKVPAGNGKTKPCNSTGTATNANYAEHAYNWAQANALAAELRGRGATVRLTRSDDRGNGPCVNTRASLANELAADLLLSIHADGSYRKGARGFHVIVSTSMAGGDRIEQESRRLAGALRAALPKEAGVPRSTYIGKGTAMSPRSDIATLNFAKVPAVMMEMGNMRNAKDAALLRSSAWRARAATAMADAISAYLG